jgi:DNA-binding GntR family transcriptional regulator
MDTSRLRAKLCHVPASHATPRARRSTSRRIQQDEIINAIERHDPEAAARIVRAHFDLSRHNMAAYAHPKHGRSCGYLAPNQHQTGANHD